MSHILQILQDTVIKIKEQMINIKKRAYFLGDILVPSIQKLRSMSIFKFHVLNGTKMQP